MESTDIEDKIKRHLQAAEQGDIIAMLNLATLYTRGQHWEESYFWGSLLARWESKNSRYSADDIFGGAHLTPEQKTAIDARVTRWEPAPISVKTKQALAGLQLQAKNGDAKAQFDLGMLYNRGARYYWSGWGIQPDYLESIKWWKLAAEQGYVDAQFELGETFSKGLGIKPDYAEAFKWYRMAADQGNEKALLNISLLSAHGYVSK